MEIQNSLNCNQLLVKANIKQRRPDGNDVIGMEESDGAEDTAEENNAEDNIKDIVEEIVEHCVENYDWFTRDTNEFIFFTNLLLLYYHLTANEQFTISTLFIYNSLPRHIH